MLFDVPVIAPARGLDQSWIDHNGHLNMAYYNVLFDMAVDHAFEMIGCGPDYVTARKMSFFNVEAHVCYVRELKPDAMVKASVQVVDFDTKRVHLFQELRHVDGWLSATSETLVLHVDMAGPRAMPMPEDVLAKITSMAEAHRSLPRPEWVGRSIGIVRKQAHGTG